MSTPAQTRPLTDQEFAGLTDDQLTKLGFKPAEQGAPADFGGTVYPNPDNLRPVASEGDPGTSTRLPDGVSLSSPKFTGPAQMDTSNPAAAQLLPSGSTTIAAKTTGSPIDSNSSPSMLSSILDAAKREGSSTINSIAGIPSGLYHAFADPATAEETKEAGGTKEVQGTKRVGLGISRLTTEPLFEAGKWYGDVARGKVPDAYTQALSVAPEAMGIGASGPIVDKMMTSLPAEHPAVAKQALTEHSAYGGSTTDPRTGASLNGTKNWSVGVAPEATQVSERPFTTQEYNDFATMHKDTLGQHQNSAIGTSYDPKTGLHSMEIVATTPSKTAAAGMASTLGEDHVFHLGTNEVVPTGAGDERPLTHLSIDDRLQQLRDNTPNKAPFSGTHFSDAKLDTIDGARRGTSGVGAESGRLRLGSQTGMGPDAPPGFHAYQSGSLPEAQIAGKKNAYSVRGQMAFGTTDEPIFQSGYKEGVQNALAKGADPQTAHQLGLNNAEHAMQNAGFDGYHTPQNPSARFVFGSHDVTPVGKYAPPENIGPDTSTPPTQVDANKPISASDDPNERFVNSKGRQFTFGGNGIDPQDVGTSKYKLPADRFTPFSDDTVTNSSGRTAVLRDPTAPVPDLGVAARAASEKSFGPMRRSGDVASPLKADGEPNWPSNYTKTSFADTDKGGANYSADDLAKLKKDLGIGGKGANNASGESAASKEALSRMSSEKSQGIKRLRIDTRSGAEMPLIGPDAVDAKAGPHEIIVSRGPQGDTILDQGARARAARLP